MYVAKRLLLSVFTVLAISALSFFIIQLPEGDIVEKYLEQTACGNYGESCVLDETTKVAMQKYFGVYASMTLRYFKWIWHLLQGDLGVSFVAAQDIKARSVKDVISDRIFMTVALTGFTVLVTWTFAVPVGIYSAVRQHSVGDYVFTFVGFTGLAIPDFLLGLVLMYVAFAYFDQSVGGLLSADRANDPWDLAKIRDLIAHLWLPAIVLGTSGSASLIRIMRNNLLDELGKPYVVTARAKGLGSFRLILKYPVRVAVNPLISTVGYLLPSLVSGSIIVSVVLSLPTLGPVLLFALMVEDVYTSGVIILMMGVLTVIGTLLSDIMLAIVDPRIKLVRQWHGGGSRRIAYGTKLFCRRPTRRLSAATLGSSVRRSNTYEYARLSPRATTAGSLQVRPSSLDSARDNSSRCQLGSTSDNCPLRLGELSWPPA